MQVLRIIIVDYIYSCTQSYEIIIIIAVTTYHNYNYIADKKFGETAPLIMVLVEFKFGDWNA